MQTKKNHHVGSELDNFLKEESLLAECEKTARERIAALKGESESATTESEQY